MGDREPPAGMRHLDSLGPVGPVSDAAVLAAVDRAERQKGQCTLAGIARQLGWTYSGAATVRLRPPLQRLVDVGVLEATDPPRRKIRLKSWKTTASGRRQLASTPRVELPESPQHRRWRHDRDVASWALDGLRDRALRILDEAHGRLELGRDGERIKIEPLVCRFRDAMKAFALADLMCHRWPEPSEKSDDPYAPSGDVSELLPEEAFGERQGVRQR